MKIAIQDYRGAIDDYAKALAINPKLAIPYINIFPSITIKYLRHQLFFVARNLNLLR